MPSPKLRCTSVIVVTVHCRLTPPQLEAARSLVLPIPKYGVAVSDLQLAGKRYVAMVFFAFPLYDIVVPSFESDARIARDLTIDAAQAARSARSAPRSLSTTQIRKLLDSRNEREVLDGLRKVITVCNTNSTHCSSEV